MITKPHVIMLQDCTRQLVVGGYTSTSTLDRRLKTEGREGTSRWITLVRSDLSFRDLPKRNNKLATYVKIKLEYDKSVILVNVYNRPGVRLLSSLPESMALMANKLGETWVIAGDFNSFENENFCNIQHPTRSG